MKFEINEEEILEEISKSSIYYDNIDYKKKIKI